MKDFLYLFQGRSDLIEKYQFLSDRNNCDAIFITYDKQISNSIYLPNSTWAEGRNFLLKKTFERDEYLYYIFCDDDIEFEKGGWDQFEDNLLSLQPAIAVPVFLEKTKATPLRLLKYNSVLYNDEQMIAYHKDVLNDGIVMPFQNQFDSIHWWASCHLQQVLIQNFYANEILQLNDVHITNKVHNRYPKINDFTKQIHLWLCDQLIDDYNEINMSIRKSLHIILWRTFKFFIRLKFSGNKKLRYTLSENILGKKLLPESELLKQHLHYSSLRSK